MTKYYTYTAIAALLCLLPAHSQARTVTVSGGISTGFDYYDRNYDSDLPGVVDTRDEDDDFQRLFIRPLLLLQSDEADNSFSMRFNPTLYYDFDHEDTGMDLNMLLTTSKNMSRHWRVRASNYLLRSDTSGTVTTLEDTTATPEDAPAGLSTDRERERYWQNRFSAGTTYTYRPESSIDMAFDYTLLRNDDLEGTTNEDYDRYSLTGINTHRYNSQWQSILNYSVVRGIIDSGTLITEADDLTGDDYSEDLWEHRFSATIANNSFDADTLSLIYNYIGAFYDSDLRNEQHIQQATFTWRRDYSPQLFTTLGAGPSYTKIEGSDGQWGGNGIAELFYRGQHTSVTLLAQKGYETENFTGSNDQGFVDYWDFSFALTHRFTPYFSTNARVAYRYEDRETTLFDDTAEGTITDDAAINEYNREYLTTTLGLDYIFLRDYSVNLAYTYARQLSDISTDEYEDNRVVLTLTWNMQPFRW